MSYVELGLGTGVAPLLEHDTIKSIASKLNKDPAQILLRWSTQKGIAVIPKSNNQKRLANNLDVCSFDIPEEDVKKIDALDQRLRFNDPTTVSRVKPVGTYACGITRLSAPAPYPSTVRLRGPRHLPLDGDVESRSVPKQ